MNDGVEDCDYYNIHYNGDEFDDDDDDDEGLETFSIRGCQGLSSCLKSLLIPSCWFNELNVDDDHDGGHGNDDDDDDDDDCDDGDDDHDYDDVDVEAVDSMNSIPILIMMLKMMAIAMVMAMLMIKTKSCWLKEQDSNEYWWSLSSCKCLNNLIYE